MKIWTHAEIVPESRLLITQFLEFWSCVSPERQALKLHSVKNDDPSPHSNVSMSEIIRLLSR